MSQMSFFNHGTALRIESPDQIVGFTTYGWGTQVTLINPRTNQPPIPEAVEDEAPGSWFHLPLSTPTEVGFRSILTSVRLVFQTTYSRIKALHIFDGPDRVETADFVSSSPTGFPPGGLTGRFDSPYTYRLHAPHQVQLGIGISFYACSFVVDYPDHAHYHDNYFHDNLLPPAALLVVAGGDANYTLESLAVGTVGNIGPVLHST